jgi:hypothetical protein
LGHKPPLLSSGHICFANASDIFAGLRRANSYRATLRSEPGLHRATSQNSAEYRSLAHHPEQNCELLCD